MTNVYNECDIDYYFIAVSKATSSVPGVVNQAINYAWRQQD